MERVRNQSVWLWWVLFRGVVNQKTNKVDKVRSFNNTSLLEPYLDDIEVNTF